MCLEVSVWNVLLKKRVLSSDLEPCSQHELESTRELVPAGSPLWDGVTAPSGSSGPRGGRARERKCQGQVLVGNRDLQENSGPRVTLQWSWERRHRASRARPAGPGLEFQSFKWRISFSVSQWSLR